jgi:spore coat protein U-like protein
MTFVKSGLCVIAAVGAFSSGSAMAGVTSTTLPVSATVLENCTVVATPMVFAATSSVGASDIDSTATITLACTPNADFDVALDNGANAVLGIRNMKIAGGAELLPYRIFRDAARSQAWGSSAGVNTQPGVAPLGAASYTAYGRIPAGTNAASAGVYVDTVTVTVTF